jgi:hypothetical protein
VLSIFRLASKLAEKFSTLDKLDGSYYCQQFNVLFPAMCNDAMNSGLVYAPLDDRQMMALAKELVSRGEFTYVLGVFVGTALWERLFQAAYRYETIVQKKKMPPFVFTDGSCGPTAMPNCVPGTEVKVELAHEAIKKCVRDRPNDCILVIAVYPPTEAIGKSFVQPILKYNLTAVYVGELLQNGVPANCLSPEDAKLLQCMKRTFTSDKLQWSKTGCDPKYFIFDPPTSSKPPCSKNPYVDPTILFVSLLLTVLEHPGTLQEKTGKSLSDMLEDLLTHSQVSKANTVSLTVLMSLLYDNGGSTAVLNFWKGCVEDNTASCVLCRSPVEEKKHIECAICNLVYCTGCRQSLTCPELGHDCTAVPSVTPELRCVGSLILRTFSRKRQTISNDPTASNPVASKKNNNKKNKKKHPDPQPTGSQ